MEVAVVLEVMEVWLALDTVDTLLVALTVWGHLELFVLVVGGNAELIVQHIGGDLELVVCVVPSVLALGLLLSGFFS